MAQDTLKHEKTASQEERVHKIVEIQSKNKRIGYLGEYNGKD